MAFKHILSFIFITSFLCSVEFRSIRNYWLLDPLAKYFPSGEKTTNFTQFVCPSNGRTFVYASKFHNLIVLKRKK